MVTLSHELEIAKKLAALANEICHGTLHADNEFTRKDYIFFALADKNFATFDAIKLLAEKGYADDAFVLVRTLAECTVNAAYVGNMTDGIANDYADFSGFMNWKEFAGLQAVAPEAVKNTPREEVDEMKRAFESVKHRYEKNKNMDWCSKSLFERAKEIDTAVSADFNLLRVIVNSPWRKASAYVHGTASSITSRVREQNSGIVIHRQFTEEEAAAALYAANLIMFALLAFVDLRLGKKRAEKWRSLHKEWSTRKSPTRFSSNIAMLSFFVGVVGVLLGVIYRGRGKVS
jgi:hypothetical protein